MAVTLADIDTIREKMQGAPDIEKSRRRITKQEAIRALYPEIEAMQRKGYTLEQIAEFVTSSGLAITVATLKSYLQRIKSQRPKLGMLDLSVLDQ
jgi:hypothetical protein